MKKVKVNGEGNEVLKEHSFTATRASGINRKILNISQKEMCFFNENEKVSGVTQESNKILN